MLNRAILVLCRSQKTSQLQKQSGLNAQLSGMSLTGLAAGPILPKSLSNLKVTSHLQRPKKSFFFYLAKLKLVILSSVYKRKILKISKSGRVI